MSINSVKKHEKSRLVFADLGFSPKEAAALQAKSKRIISEKLAIKESLMTELSTWIDEKKLRVNFY